MAVAEASSMPRRAVLAALIAAPRRLATTVAVLPVAVLPLVVALATTARADPEDDDGARFACAKPKQSFEVAFPEEVGVRDLVTWGMSISCKRFVYAAGVANRSAKLTLITPGKLDAGAAWALFEAGLDAMGLAAVPKGPVYEIVEAAHARDAALAIRTRFPEGGGAPVRVLLRPAHVAVADLAPALELVKSRAGTIAPLLNLRALLITDDGRHVARMRALVDELDRPAAGAGVWAVPVLHRDPAGLIEVLEPMLRDPVGKPEVGGPRLVADRRASALFVVGSAADHQRVAALVAVLDRDTGDTALTAVRLRNAKAAEVVTALTPLVTGGDGKGEATIRLAADPGTNAVLIQASPTDAAAVRAMVDELDLPRRRICVEAMVLEVSATASRALGVSWHAASAGDDGTVTLGGLQTGSVSSIDPATSLAGAGAGAVAGVLGASLTSTLLGESVPSFGALVHAVATRGEVEVVASPHVMTLDNKETTLSIGVNIPYKSRAASANPLTGSGEQIERRDLALTLKLTPHVAPAAAATTGGDRGDVGGGPERIHLDIAFEHDQLGDSDFAGLGPTWKQRKLTTSVVVDDQESVVLGGLIDERIETSSQRTPLLGDLPIVGALFRSQSRVRAKQNLLIVITPHLIDDSLAGRALFERRMRERDEFLRARTSLLDRLARPRVDYGKKRGLIAEIDATVRGVERERAARAALELAPPPRGRVDVAPTPAPSPSP
jgi:general secretion pathway protein D